MLPCAMKNKVFTSNYGGCIGGKPSYPGASNMAKEPELSSSIYGMTGTKACICFHEDSLVCAKFTTAGWLVPYRGGC